MALRAEWSHLCELGLRARCELGSGKKALRSHTVMESSCIYQLPAIIVPTTTRKKPTARSLVGQPSGGGGGKALCSRAIKYLLSCALARLRDRQHLGQVVWASRVYYEVASFGGAELAGAEQAGATGKGLGLDKTTAT